MNSFIVLFCLVASIQQVYNLPQGSSDYEDVSFWLKSAQENLQKMLVQKNIERRAKNIIVFIGDGMGMASVTAGRIFTGQRKGQTGEEYKLVFETFPNTGFSKTYNIDKQVPDSAGTATAIFSGVKSRYKVIGLDSRAAFNSCDATMNEKGKLTTVVDWAQATDMDTGFVTTTRITHATPAALYAHVNHRDWECDSAIPPEYKDCCKDIARQLIEDAPGNKLKVILGGGGQIMGTKTPDPIDRDTCTRKDGKDLTKIWQKLNPRGKVVKNAAELMAVDIQNTSKLLGVFSPSHMPYSEVRTDETPSLANMTLQAIRMLKKNENGFFLMVESGKIDLAHHKNYAQLALREVTELEEAVKVALREVKIEESLIIVTADHSHSFTMNGYPNRGNDILGFATNVLDHKAKPYETLTYANGPGFYHHVNNNTNSSSNIWLPVEEDKTRNDPFYQHLATFYLKDDTHGGEDVGLYAIGPYAHLFRGTFEQNYISHVIAYAACLKDWPSHCDRHYTKYYYDVSMTDSSSRIPALSIFTITVLSLLSMLCLT
ncbi:alkaline phosphatase 4-like [Chelonus insularis]|uniref:alkaline phosphatase 4-like n=1 Tax=Chelonus insularis TaxID=460826 RepID=UPI00158EE357|nr:alkaline phosphatase 4-like [Chelonus insularis]XP_034933859.1 alkaline phosphatase 4-like [Chelonus insularis]XP_034933860.1 alkaline phosphatase 4-like [Chelonus insularis]XP_034933861.1 alkaline phosphatase 4-like [Chelonus insularis]